MIQKGNATLLRFPKDYFAADVDRNKYLHATSSNAVFSVHYFSNLIDHNLHTVTFPIHVGSNAMLELKKYFLNLNILNSNVECWKPITNPDCS